MRQETVVEGIKSIPPASVIGATIMGLTIQEWASIAALAYTLILIHEKLWPRFVQWRSARRGGGAT